MDNIGGLLVFGLLVTGLAWWIVRTIWEKQQVGELTLPNGHVYTYLMGDYMRSYGRGGWFHGIDVSLPREMPHIYLNSLRGGGRRSQYVIDASQHVRLEGNFNKDFQAFVPKKYEVLALSILSPDVMATLQDNATAFDVEIYGSHVRIISNKRLLPRKALQVAALYAAAKVMQEVDHRLASWSRSDSLDAANQELVMYPNGGYRLFGMNVKPIMILWGVYWIIVALGFGVLGAYLSWYTNFRTWGLVLLGVFVALLLGTFLLTRLGLKKSRFRSRH